MKERTKAGIKGSKIFLVIGTSSYFEDIPKQEVLLAKNLGKPFRVLLDKDVVVPAWFKENVVDYKQKVVNLKTIHTTKAGWMKDFLKLKD